MSFRFCPACGNELAEGTHGERVRMGCSACGWVHWDNPTPVVAAIVELDGRVLLARNAAWSAKMFALVTGFLERGESPSAAIEREVLEETALVARRTELVGVYDFPRRNQVIIAYHVVAEGEVRLSEELVDYKLVEPADLRPWPQGTGPAVADWMRARGLSVIIQDLDRS